MNRYEKFGHEKLILRDHLAIDRTVMANERTFLSYARTALTLFVAGVTFWHFFESQWLSIVGWAFVPMALGTFLIGALRYRNMKNLIARVDGSTATEASPTER